MVKAVDVRKHDVQARLDAVGWGLLFLLVAALALPEGNVEFISAAVLGGLMLSLNGVRLVIGAPVRWFTVVLGGSMFLGGTAAVFGIRMDVVVLFFALAGLVTIAGALWRRGPTVA